MQEIFFIFSRDNRDYEEIRERNVIFHIYNVDNFMLTR